MHPLVDFSCLLHPTGLAIVDVNAAATGIFIIFWLVVLGGIVGRVLRRTRMRFGSSHWIPTQAVVESGFTATPNETDLVPSRNNMAGLRLVLQYSYSVSGEYYSGYLLLKPLHRTRDGAMDEFAQWKDRPLVVRYDPNRPQRSACLPEDGAPPDSSSLGNEAPDSIDMVSLPLS